MKSSFSSEPRARREKPLSFASLMPAAIMIATLALLANTSRPLSGQERKLAKVSATEAYKAMTSKPVDLKSEYEQGVFLEITKNFDEAAVAYRQAANLGYPPAQNNLGYFYQTGQGVSRNYDEAMRLSREAIRQRADFVGGHRVLTAAAGMAGLDDVAKVALQELRRAQPNISLAWIASHMPIKLDADREHYLEAFRRAGLD